MAVSNVEFYVQCTNRLIELELLIDQNNAAQKGVLDEMKRDLERFFHWIMSDEEIDEMQRIMGIKVPPCVHSLGYTMSTGVPICNTCGREVEI